MRKCPNCNTSLKNKRQGAIYCSNNCRSIASNNKLRPPKPIIKCLHCKNIIDGSKQRNAKYCDTTCKSAFFHERNKRI